MANVTASVHWLDRFQQRHGWLGFIIAVIKKYGEDNIGQQAALITYYVFLSLFPLLLITLEVLSLTLAHHPTLEQHVTHSLFTYFPVIGQNLQNSIHTPHRQWLVLAVEALITIYGMRGTAGIVRQTLNKLWGDGFADSGFKISTLKNFGLIITGAVGLLLTTSLASYIGGVGGHHALGRGVAILISLVVNFALIFLALRISIMHKIKTRQLWLAALITTIAWNIIQNLGGFIIAHEFKNSSALYGIFGLILGLIFWIYLQTELALYAVTINVVAVQKSWPRKLL